METKACNCGIGKKCKYHPKSVANMEGLKVKHTPGSWTVKADTISGRSHRVVDDRGRRIATTAQLGSPELFEGAWEEREANAHLIASAPELLEALHKVVNEAGYALRYKHGEDVDTLRKALANMIVLCADPISKAEGRS